MTSFANKVIAVVKKIPPGHTLSYQEVAKQAGNIQAARAVGAILHSYDHKHIIIPCHRVIRKNGTIGGYRWGKNKKRILLNKERISL